jgi:hypothetical protein
MHEDKFKTIVCGIMLNNTLVSGLTQLNTFGQNYY